MNNLKKYGIYLAIASIGILLGALLFGGSDPHEKVQTPDEHIAESHTDAEGNVVYTCSMHPSIRQNEPGNCPICGMDLIPADDNSSEEVDANALTMSLAAMKLAEIETSVVQFGSPVSVIYMPGKIVADQNKVSSITSHAAGRVINLYVDYEGAFIKEGQKIASLYSPELISAQQEFLQTVKFKEQNPVLYTSAKRKLALLELPTSTIEYIEESGEVLTEIDIVSQATGYVTKLNVSRQEHVMRGGVLFEVADLSSVWVMFNAYESDLSLLKKGQKISFTTASYPGEEFEGIIDFIEPSVNSLSRTVEVRVEVTNPDLKLKPNMLAEGILEAKVMNGRSITVPKSAVLWTGPRSVVFVKVPNTTEPAFIAREVTLGSRIGNEFVILEGLEAGEEVVTDGNFKLDAAAQLSDKLSMMNRTPGTGANRTGHEGHTMGAESPTPEVMEQEDHSNHQSQNQSMEVSPSPATFKEQLNVVVQKYLVLKDALVNSNFQEATTSVPEIQSALGKVDMTLVKGEEHNLWMAQLNQMNADLKALSNATDLEAQHLVFLKLSETLIQSVKTFGLPGVIYQQFCPMANGNKGANWLSDSEEIANPFFGDKMHSCGETITKIEF